MGSVKNMVGVNFNGCLVIEREGVSKDKKATWKCRCYCGKIFTTSGKTIRSGYVKSCGCLKTKVIVEVGKKNKTHGETKTRLYDIWRGMKKRCHKETDSRYKNYGAKGIKVCDEWFLDYEAFRNWSLENGYSENLTIDRIDNKEGYKPSNCRWVDWKTQARNRTNNVLVMFEGEKVTLSQVAEIVGLSREAIWYRHKKGIDFNLPKKK
jgi:hypothetical protein